MNSGGQGEEQGQPQKKGKGTGKGGNKWATLLMAAALTLTVIGSCLQVGLYFSRSVYLPASLWLTGAAAVLLRRRGYVRTRGAGGTAPAVSRAILAAAGPGGVALLYALRLGAGPLSMQGTVDAVLRWSWLAVLAAALAWTAARPGGRLLLRAGWELAGMVLAYTALAAVYGLIPLPHAVLRTADSGTAAFGARLGGLLQYPNTFGAVMGAFLVLQLLRLARLPQAAAPCRRLAASAQALPCGLCLLLSESRGAWLAAAAAWTAAVLTARGPERGRLMLRSGWILAGALILYRRLAQAQLAPAALPGLAELAAVWAAALLVLAAPPMAKLSGLAARPLLHLLPLLSRPLQRPASRRRPSGRTAAVRPLLAGLAAGAVVLAAALIPLGGDAAQAALRTGTSTLNARLIMFRDAFRLFREAPWLGQGGDVWRSAYRSVQSAPYAGSVMHSGLLDMLLNLGLIGGAAWLAWLFVQGYRLAARRSEWFWAYLILALHALIDFDWAFGVYGLLLVWIAETGISARGSSDSLGWGSFNRAAGSRLAALRPIPAALSRLKAARSHAAIIALAICLLAGGLSGWRLMLADQVYRRAVTSGREAAPAAELARALRLNPLQPHVRATLAAKVSQQEAVLLLRSGLRYNPRSPELYSRLAEAAASGGDLRTAAWWAEALRLDRFDPVKQTEALRSLAALADHKRSRGEEAEAALAARAGLLLYQRYMTLDQLLSHPAGGFLPNDRGFHVTREARETAGVLKREWEQKLRLGEAAAPDSPNSIKTRRTPPEKPASASPDPLPTARRVPR
ncbi:hypothetical protein AWM70_15465 [Paenibacillus yonginensis]|uniref:O-antigen ligase-related domain-containing protein n=1 Tax=Paenibacillus yonginensis TaxID=1462996 RepID=A0A1B1N314_9BACL|nr:O-antigen ligase family protein [Paenibacillus yonginensis]ANS75810.1 hypothetical protein AWM70_15465 [Paenibacillus yonginensis]